MNEQDTMTISQVCSYLNLTATKISQLAESGLIPTVKVGHELKFSRTALDQWLALKPKVQRLGRAPE